MPDAHPAVERPDEAGRPNEAGRSSEPSEAGGTSGGESSCPSPTRRGGPWRDESGFTLPELLIVLVIIGILALLAIPRFFSVTARAKMAEAKLMLKQVYTLQEAHYYEYDGYADGLDAIGFEQARLVTEEGTARYVIGIEETDGGGFTATATSVVDFDKDGAFNVWEVDETGVIRQRVAD